MKTRNYKKAYKKADAGVSGESAQDRALNLFAEMMISGNTKGVIKSIQHHRQYMGRDERVTDLSKKLLETENRNIEQMKPFL